MPGWVWILLLLTVLLAIGWNYDRKRRPTRGLDRPAVTGHAGGRSPTEARLGAELRPDAGANAEGHWGSGAF